MLIFKIRTMNRELRILNFAFILFMILASLFIIQPVFAVCDATEMAKPVAERSTDCAAGLDQIELIFKNVISVVVGLAFVAMFVLLVWAGIKYLTSGGEPKAVQSAHQIVTWALLGIIFMAIAWLVLQLIHVFTGIDVTTFNVKALCGDIKTLPFCQPSP